MAVEFSFYLWRQDKALCPGQPDWSKPLPLTRNDIHQAQQRPSENQDLSYGGYFESIREFICANQYGGLIHGIRQQSAQEISPAQIRAVAITAEKHGAFYHPARATVTLDTEAVITFVVNVAITTEAGQVLAREYQHLKYLSAQDDRGFLPRCYHFDVMEISGQANRAMLLGQWFDGYHEFHLSKDSPAASPALCVWNDINGPIALDDHQTQQLYHNAALILTAFYNPITFEQIYPWHHAAGDFIVRVDSAGLDLKLITVRNYAPLFDHPGFEDESRSPEEVLFDSLLIFLLNLSTRMRLDRLDGVGPVVWAPDEAVTASVSGFFEGLAIVVRRHGLPEELSHRFKGHLSGLEQRECEDLLTGIFSSLYHPQAPELPVLTAHLADHARLFCEAAAGTL